MRTPGAFYLKQFVRENIIGNMINQCFIRRGFCKLDQKYGSQLKLGVVCAVVVESVVVSASVEVDVAVCLWKNLVGSHLVPRYIQRSSPSIPSSGGGMLFGFPPIIK